MLIKFSLNKMCVLLVAASFTLVSNLVMAEQEHTTIIKLEQNLSEIKLMVDQGKASHVLQFNKSELGSAALNEKISQLPQEVQSEVHQALHQLKSGKPGQVKVIEEKIMHRIVDAPVAPDAPPAPNAPAALPHDVQVMKFVFETKGEAGHEFLLIKSLLEKATLNSEQKQQIQSLLNSK